MTAVIHLAFENGFSEFVSYMMYWETNQPSNQPYNEISDKLLS
jgi:hypothetical protein